MTSRTDNTTKWKALSEVDYFGLFIKNWLAFNSWYKSHYSSLKTDREIINEIKNTSDKGNNIYKVFSKIFNGNDRDASILRDSIDGLITSLQRETLLIEDYLEKGKEVRLSFENAYLSNESRYVNLLYIPTEKERNSEHKGNEVDYIRLSNSVCIIKDLDIFYNGLIEILYQTRCSLFHGHLAPNDGEHQVVKYSYLIVNLIMKNI